MYRLRMESCLLLGAALLAACSDRNTPTAPVARPLAATAALVDRPYTWTFTCKGDELGITASWYWTQNGYPVTATSQTGCLAAVPMTGTRPADANGLTATVGTRSNSWTFDPAGPFSASLAGSVSRKLCTVRVKGWCQDKGEAKETGTLTVDS